MSGLKRRWVLVVAGLLFAATAVTLFVALSVALDLAAARRTLFVAPQRLETEDVEDALARLERAEGTLESLPARAVGWLPVVKQNFDAVHAVAEGAAPLLTAALELGRAIDEVQAEEVFVEGAVNLELLGGLEAPLRDEVGALADLAEIVEARRNGWLLPPLWSDLNELLDRLEELERSTGTAADMIALAPQMLGGGEPRTYLVALLNNTELRGAGGILSGVGSVTVRNGRMSLGDFQHYRQLAGDPPYRKVPAPADFEEHFGAYQADTTRWVTASSSPDVPDVALVTSRLFEVTAGIKTDGVIFVDPRGLAALMPPAAKIDVPTTQTSLTAEELPTYVYRDAYSELGGAVSRRRDSLIGLGEAAFDVILERGFTRPSVLRAIGESFAGGHLSMISFEAEESRVLESSNLSRDLGAPSYDGILATVQNIGGNKLDSYARRSIHHGCRIDGDSPARCATEVTIQNQTPAGLTRFEYQYRPYGLFKNVVEIYIPAAAKVVSVEADGESADYFEAPEDGFEAIGVYVEIPRGGEAKIAVAYDLPHEDSYSLEVLPQPLVDDARLRVELAVPSAWTVDGPEGVVRGDVAVWEGELDRIIEFHAGPSEKSGLSALWEKVGRFMSEPVF